MLGGTIRGYRYGVRLEGGRNHRLSGIDVSGSRRQLLRSTAERLDSLDRLDVAHGSTRPICTARAHAPRHDRRVASRASSPTAVRTASAWWTPAGRTWRTTIWRTTAAGRSTSSARATTPSCGTTPRAPGGVRGFDTDCSAAADPAPRGQRLEHDRRERPHGLHDRRAGDRAVAADPASVGNLVYRNDASLATVVGVRGAGHLERELPREPGRQRRRAASSSAGSRAGPPRQHGDRRPTSGDRRHPRWRHRDRGQRAARRPARHPDHDRGRASSRRAAVTGSTTTCWTGWARASCCRGSPTAGCGATCSTGVGDGLVVDGTGHGTEVSGNVFLRARAGSSTRRTWWPAGTTGPPPTHARAAAQVRGRVSVLPWKPASAAGY